MAVRAREGDGLSQFSLNGFQFPAGIRVQNRATPGLLRLVCQVSLAYTLFEPTFCRRPRTPLASGIGAVGIVTRRALDGTKRPSDDTSKALVAASDHPALARQTIAGRLTLVAPSEPRGKRKCPIAFRLAPRACPKLQTGPCGRAFAHERTRPLRQALLDASRQRGFARSTYQARPAQGQLRHLSQLSEQSALMAAVVSGTSSSGSHSAAVRRVRHVRRYP
jgi:hypothetical protein